MHHLKLPGGTFHIKPTTNPSVLALEVSQSEDYRSYSLLDVELIVYPYDLRVKDNDGIVIKPYDSYLEDLTNYQKTLYAPSASYGENIFGILLGVLISLVFWLFNRGELFGLQSIVAIIGVYLVGKEIWSDLEQLLIDATEKWPVRYHPIEYSYSLRSETTLDLYTNYARSKKYKRDLVLAEKMDSIHRSNARDIKLSYSAASFVNDNNEQDSSELRKRLCLLYLNDHVKKDYQEGKLLISAKVSMHKQIMGITRSCELFQAIEGDRWGCLDLDKRWVEEAVFIRNTLQIGRVKVYLNSRVQPGLRFLE